MKWISRKPELEATPFSCEIIGWGEYDIPVRKL